MVVTRKEMFTKGRFVIDKSFQFVLIGSGIQQDIEGQLA
jgi:hypothetical protein